MGTQYSVSFALDKPLDSKRRIALDSEILATLNQINQSMSTYLPNSELSQINAAAARVPLSLSPDLAVVIEEALNIGELSNHAFDITLGPVIRIWGFDRDGRIERTPSNDQLSQLRASIGQDKLLLSGAKLIKVHPATEINLSAIAKGFAVDKLAQQFDAHGFSNYLIDIGGELKGKGHNANRNPWQVAIERPVLQGGIQQVISLVDAAIATSGDYRNFVVIDNVRYAHTIDIKTLRPKNSRLASVTVIDPSAMRADAWATALMALDVKAALRLANERGLTTFMIERNITASDEQDLFRFHQTGNFPKLN